MADQLRTIISHNGKPVAGLDAAPKAVETEIRINGETVPNEFIAAEMQNHSAPRGKPGLARRKAANAVAIRKLLVQEAQSRGIVAECQAVGPGRHESEEEALIRALLEECIDVDRPDSDAIHAEWQKDPSRFRAPPLWEVSHILCACDPKSEEARADAFLRASGLLKQVLADPRMFPAIAARESDCGSKANGGALGQLGPGDTVPEFEAALRDLAEGEIAREPVCTCHGYHVIRMDAVAKGRVLPFEAVRDKIATAMEKAAWARQVRAFTARLVESADVQGTDLKPG